MEKEILRLFKGFLTENKETQSFSKKALKYGILISSQAKDSVVDEAISQYGKDGEKWNETFHKDFEVVYNAPIEDLIEQQLIHYITTYGFEQLNIYNSNTVYIPVEKLEIPEIEINEIELINIKPLTKEELSENIMSLLTSGIALSEQTIRDIVVLSDFIDKDRFDEIKNREIKTFLYDKYNMTPKNPDEFLRYLIYKTTGATLKIQNDELISKIQKGNKKDALKKFNSYLKNTDNGYAKLASIFLRNKKLFLAFKAKNNHRLTANGRELNHIINKIKKMSKKYHKPLKENILNCLTNKDCNIEPSQLMSLLDDITIFREIRLLNGLLYRKGNPYIIMYKIRNNKSFVKELNENDVDYFCRLNNISNIVRQHLINRISKKVNGKTIYIPENIVYAAPTSEKQFVGNIPEGSFVKIPRDANLIYGIYWKNIEVDSSSNSRFYGEESCRWERVDLDIKQMNKNEVFGWDASYRSDKRDILFSGDMTDARLPKGASELFYVDQAYEKGAFLVTLNNYTSNSTDVPFEFVIARAKEKPQIQKYHTLDPNDIIEKVNLKIERQHHQMILGLIKIDNEICFYFNNFELGNLDSISSRNDKILMGAFDYLKNYNEKQLKLNDILKEAGAIITNSSKIFVDTGATNENGEDIVEEVDVDIDLSLNSITKETIIDLLGE